MIQTDLIKGSLKTIVLKLLKGAQNCLSAVKVEDADRRLRYAGGLRYRDAVDGAIRGISTRLSRNGDKLRACLPVLRAYEDEAQAAFEVFFPQLIEATSAMRTTLWAESAP